MSSAPDKSSLTPARMATIQRHSSASLRSTRSALDLLSNSQSSPGSALQPHLSRPHISADTFTAPSSSSSSVSNIDIGDASHGMLMASADTESDLVDAEGEVRAAEGDTGQALRESLKKTLIQQDDLARRGRRHSLSVDEAHGVVGSSHPPKQYFVLTNAGKPVFISRRGSLETSQDEITSAIGVMQAIISVYADDGDKIRSINAGNTRITFLLRAPLYYVCVSSWGEPKSAARLHLEYLHLQILSVVTGAQLSKIFEKRTNFDLRRLLDGTERFLHTLITRLELDLGMATASLNVLRVEATVRAKIAELLVPTKDLKETLYVLMIANNKVVTLIRPKKHSVHPADLHLLLNTLSSSSLSQTPDASSWLPICLPKFNPNGFLHTYVSFVQETSPPHEVSPRPSTEGEDAQNTPTEEVLTEEPQSMEATRIGLAIVTADRDGFEKLRDWGERTKVALASSKLLRPIFQAASTQDFTSSSLGIPGLRHFVYKSRTHVQLVGPSWEEPYATVDEKRRLITLYEIVHDSVHARSGQPGGPLKLQFIKTDQECILGWVTTPFELYIALSPRLPKSAAVGAANAVTRWIKKHESELFLINAPVF